MALVVKPVGACPQCNYARYGGVMIVDNSVIYGCGKCNYSQRYVLPALNKKIVYLDQSLISLMYKSKQLGRGGPEWSELYSLLDAMILDQALVCPNSSFHREESELSHHHRDGLIDFSRRVSKGVRLQAASKIRQNQTVQALEQFLAASPPTLRVGRLPWSDAFRENPHKWHPYLSVWADFPYDEDVIETRRQTKGEVVETLNEVVERWRSERLTVDQIYTEELSAPGANTWASYVLYLVALREAIKPVDVYRDAGSSVLLCESLLSYIGRPSPEGKDLLILRDFLHSSHFRLTPHITIQAKILAEYGRRAQLGRDAQSGDAYDVQIVSLLAPYCDAIYVDNFFRDLLTSPSVNLPELCGTAVFSASNMDEFRSYLQEVHSSTSADLGEALRVAYPKRGHS